MSMYSGVRDKVLNRINGLAGNVSSKLANIGFADMRADLSGLPGIVRRNAMDLHARIDAYGMSGKVRSQTLAGGLGYAARMSRTVGGMSGRRMAMWGGGATGVYGAGHYINKRRRGY